MYCRRFSVLMCFTASVCLCAILGCQPCSFDTDCDDGLYCNGAETCDVDLAMCIVGEAPCDGDHCDERANRCHECITRTECYDADLCTDDRCVDGECEYVVVECGEQLCDPGTGDCVDCLEDWHCTDYKFCTGVETCGVHVCEPGTYPCADDEECDEDTDECVPTCYRSCYSRRDCDDYDVCTYDACSHFCCEYTDVDCDDGLFCTGVETCDPQTGCISPGDPCAEDEVCDEVNDECIECITCTDDVDCADDDVCTHDSCVDFCCEYTDVDCDDGLFCTGVETCDPQTGCISPGDPCAKDEMCDEVNDECPVCTVCTEHADCADNGLFCDGTEECDLDAGCCVSTGNPCAQGQTCDEVNWCVDIDCTGDGTCRMLPSCYEPGVSFTVSIEIVAPSGTFVVQPIDTPPSGWSVSASTVSDNGNWDTTFKQVKWALIENLSRTVTYEVAPPSGATDRACFTGTVIFDGATEQNTAGDQCVEMCP